MTAKLLPCCVSVMIAQLTFRGMPLAQGMTLAQVICLHGLGHTEVRALLKAVVELPTTVPPEKNISWSGRTFLSLGDAACHCIVMGLSQKHDIYKIGLLIRVIGWTALDKLAFRPVTISDTQLMRAPYTYLVQQSLGLHSRKINTETRIRAHIAHG